MHNIYTIKALPSHTLYMYAHGAGRSAHALYVNKTLSIRQIVQMRVGLST